MRAVNFDTLKYSQELKKSGMKSQEAEAITRATAEAWAQLMDAKELATKTDILNLEKSIKELEIASKEDIKKLELSTKINMKELELTLSKEINSSMWKTIGYLMALQTFVGLVSGPIKHYFG